MNKYNKSAKPEEIDIFSQFKKNILNIDPVTFAENNLTLDGKPFRLTKNGYKPFSDIYRYIGLKAVERKEPNDPNSSKPIVLVKGRQVGATTMCSILECYFATCGLYGNNERSPIRIMHLFPTLALAANYTKTKLDQMIGAAKPVPGALKSNGMLKSFVEAAIDGSSPGNNAIHMKKFYGGNEIRIESPGADGDRVRGSTEDVMFFDEVQDTPTLAIGASVKLLTKAQYGTIGQGVQVYFGTPKNKGTSYWNMWQMSSQQYYHLFCEACEQHFPLYRPDVKWEDIWLYGFIVKCTHCDHEQDKRIAAEKGRWIALNPDENYKFVGFHINQLYIPDFTKEHIVGQKPENNPINTEKIYQNEVLGEFYDGEGSTLSPEQIHEKCADIGRGFSRQISRDTGHRVYMGFDWGQRGNLDMQAGKQRGQSYSCGIVITVPSPQLIQIEYATRLTKTDPEHKHEVVEEMFRRYSPHVSIGDIGDAYDLTHILQRKYPDRFLASRAAPKVEGHVKFRADIFPKEIIFERDYYISELMGLLKSGNVRFPYGSYEEIMWLVNHCCSMEVKVTMNRSQDPVRRFIKGPTPNDGFMALLNAYLAYKFDVTQGFKIKQPQFMKFEIAKKKHKIPAVLGYIPRFR